MNLATDVAVVTLAVFAARATESQAVGAEAGSLAWIAAALVCTWIVTATALRHYATVAYERSIYDDAAMIATLAGAVVTVLAVLDLTAPASALLPPFSITLALVFLCPLLLRATVFRPISGREAPVRSVLIVGIGPLGRLTAMDLLQRTHCRIAGHLRFDRQGDADADLLRRTYAEAGATPALLGPAGEIEAVLRTVAADEVYIAGRLRKHADEMQACISVCERFGVPFAMPAYTFRFERAHLAESHGIVDGYLHYLCTSGKQYQRSVKRLIDIAASAAALWLLLPLFAVVAASIRLTSRGPVFFKQERVGRYGRHFSLLKFRSMVLDAESLRETLAKSNELSGPVFKMKRDPRVTAVGRFIRKYSIDELPQLINVLRGDMSLVGPRPPLPAEVEKYEAWQRRRLSVRPGLTCIWQVSGRNQISFEEWMYLDMQYIDQWSLALDLSLIVRTLPIVLTGRGAS
ncbi:MAG TPA: sugar transferase [Myxococcales bacterium]|nr:sugar transferase [Myxococcales bacterium]